MTEGRWCNSRWGSGSRSRALTLVVMLCGLPNRGILLSNKHASGSKFAQCMCEGVGVFVLHSAAVTE